MKELLFALALMVATVQTASAVVTEESVRIFHQCMRELDIKSFQSEKFLTDFVCINVCEDEKAGLVVEGKYLEDKYIESYIKSFPKAGQTQVSIQSECIREANNQKNKCDVGRSLQNCQMKNHSTLYDKTLKREVINEVEED